MKCVKGWLLGCTLCLAGAQVQAQQNLVNVPSGDITPKNKWFFQQQINFANIQTFTSKTHFVWGLGKGWEVGANLLNMSFNTTARPVLRTSAPPNKPTPFYPVGVITAQKQWKINNKWSVNLGTQAGTNLSRSIDNKRFTHFTYGLARFNPNKDLKFLAGPYVSDRRMLGDGNLVGYMAGIEWHVHKRWLLLFDHISGNNKNSVSVIGATYNVTEQFQLIGGWQIPNPNSPEVNAFVVEVNIFNF